MRRLLIHTFLAVLIPVGLLFFLLLPQIGGMAVLVALIMLFVAPFPTYITILLYRWMQKKLLPNHHIYSSLLAILTLLVIYHLGVLCFFYMSEKQPLTVFAREYFYNLPACLIVISIPIAEWVMLKVERDLKAAQ